MLCFTHTFTIHIHRMRCTLGGKKGRKLFRGGVNATPRHSGRVSKIFEVQRRRYFTFALLPFQSTCKIGFQWSQKKVTLLLWGKQNMKGKKMPVSLPLCVKFCCEHSYLSWWSWVVEMPNLFLVEHFWVKWEY